MNYNERRRRAEIALRAERYRRAFKSDDDVWDSIEHIEFDISEYGRIGTASRSEILDGDLPREARVRFFKNGRMLLEYTHDVAREAMAGLSSAHFKLAHEIGHAALHQPMMRSKNEGASRNFSGGAVRTMHHETAKMEYEADLFGLLLLIPLSKITIESDPLELAKVFNAPPSIATFVRREILEVWSIIKEIKRKSKDG